MRKLELLIFFVWSWWTQYFFLFQLESCLICVLSHFKMHDREKNVNYISPYTKLTKLTGNFLVQIPPISLFWRCIVTTGDIFFVKFLKNEATVPAFALWVFKLKCKMRRQWSLWNLRSNFILKLNKVDTLYQLQGEIFLLEKKERKAT